MPSTVSLSVANSLSQFRKGSLKASTPKHTRLNQTLIIISNPLYCSAKDNSNPLLKESSSLKPTSFPILQEIIYCHPMTNTNICSWESQLWLEGNLGGKISYNDNHHSFNLVPKINSWLRHYLCIHSSHVTCNHYIKTLNLA